MAKNKRSKKSKKKAKSTFLRDPAESILSHLGNAIDRAKPDDLIDAAINVGLAYWGGTLFGWTVPSLLAGPVALKLAKSWNLVAGTSGVAMLAIMGIAQQGPVQDIVTAITDPNTALIGGQLVDKNKIVAPFFSETFPYELKCPEGYRLVRGPSAALCIPTE